MYSVHTYVYNVYKCVQRETTRKQRVDRMNQRNDRLAALR